EAHHAAPRRSPPSPGRLVRRANRARLIKRSWEGYSVSRAGLGPQPTQIEPLREIARIANAIYYEDDLQPQPTIHSHNLPSNKMRRGGKEQNRGRNLLPRAVAAHRSLVRHPLHEPSRRFLPQIDHPWRHAVHRNRWS